VRSITNTGLIASRTRWARYLSFAGMLILLAGAALTWFGGEAIVLPVVGETSPVVLSWAALLVGFVVTNAAIYLANRYGVRHQPHLQIDEELRTLDDRYVTLHHIRPLPHFLLGPSGAYVFTIKPQSGLIRYGEGRWRQDLPFKWLRMAFQEGLGNPAREATLEAEQLARHIAKRQLAAELPVQPIVVFVNPGAQVQVEDAPVPAVHVNKLLGLLRQLERDRPAVLSQATVTAIAAGLGGAQTARQVRPTDTRPPDSRPAGARPGGARPAGAAAARVRRARRKVKK
jgi:hypothetical protein